MCATSKLIFGDSVDEPYCRLAAVWSVATAAAHYMESRLDILRVLPLARHSLPLRPLVRLPVKANDVSRRM